MSRVHLAVYDLSRGMATAMSQAILGQRIDGIWHTGIVVFNNEYYFGGGIQVTRTGAFAAQNGMQPVEMQDMGLTTKTQNELEAFLRTINHQYTQATYDLINNNCNNFANTVCNFLVNHGIPMHIVDLPRIVFSTPGGAMLRPMIEGMQNNIRQQSGNGMDPFGGAAPQAALPSGGGGGMQPFESALSNQLTQAVHHSHPHNSASSGPPQKKIKSLPAVLEERPLVSNDANTVRVIANKIINLTVSVATTEGVEEKVSALNEVEKEVLNTILTSLTTATATTSDSASSGFDVTQYALLEKVLETFPTCHMAALFVLRLMLAREQQNTQSNTTKSDQNTTSSLPHYHSIVRNVIHRLLSYTTSKTTDSLPSSVSFSSVPAYAMAVCCVSNLLAHTAGVRYLLGDYQRSIDTATHSSHTLTDDFLIDIMLSALAHSRSEIRQMGATLAYNYTLACTPLSSGVGNKVKLSEAWKQEDDSATPGQELHPHALQLLCCCLEGVSTDTDPVVRKRRLSVVLRIFRAYGAVAADFVSDLGYSDVILILESDKTVQPALGAEEVAIVSELAGFYQ